MTHFLKMAACMEWFSNNKKLTVSFDSWKLVFAYAVRCLFLHNKSIDPYIVDSIHASTPISLHTLIPDIYSLFKHRYINLFIFEFK